MSSNGLDNHNPAHCLHLNRACPPSRDHSDCNTATHCACAASPTARRADARAWNWHGGMHISCLVHGARLSLHAKRFSCRVGQFLPLYTESALWPEYMAVPRACCGAYASRPQARDLYRRLYSLARSRVCPIGQGSRPGDCRASSCIFPDRCRRAEKAEGYRDYPRAMPHGSASGL